MQYQQQNTSQPPLGYASSPQQFNSFHQAPETNTQHAAPYSLQGSSNAPNPNAQSFAGPQFGGSGNTWGASPSYGAGGSSMGASGAGGGSGAGYPQFGAGGFAGGQAAQFGGGSQGMGGGQGNGQMQGYGDKTKKVYLPGYLSGPMGRSRSTPPRTTGDDEARSWDSPASHSGSPARFGNQSLFGGTRDGTPSRSPKAEFTPPPRRANRVELEDAPPVMSLGDMDTTSDSPSSSLAFRGATRPVSTATPQASTPAFSNLSTSPTKVSAPQGCSITIFGFPSSSRQHVLAYFAEFGEIISTTPSPVEGNWVTVTYAQAWSAARAARKNGEVLGGVLMVGVKLNDDSAPADTRAASVAWNPTLAASSTPGFSTPTSSMSSAKPPLSNVGKPIHLLGPESAFKATPPRRSFMSTSSTVAASSGVGGAGAGNPGKSLFAERNRAGVREQEGDKGVLGKITGAVFGW